MNTRFKDLPLLAVTLGALTVAGCGGGKTPESEPVDTASAPAPPAAAPAQADVVAAPVQQPPAQAAKPAGDSPTDELFALGGGSGNAEAAPAGGAGAPAGGPPGGGSMMEMMAAQGRGGPPPGMMGSGGMSGMGGGGNQMPPPGYPMPGGGPPGSDGGGMAAMMAGRGGAPPGAGGSAGMSGMMGGGQNMPPPGYPMGGGSDDMAAMMRARMGAPGSGGPPGMMGPQGGPEAGMMPRGGFGGGAADMAAMMGRGGAGVPGMPGAADAAPDYSDPIKGAETFLNALQKKDLALLAEATALRAPYESKDDRRKKMFEAIRNENLPAEELDEMARAFDGMKVININNPSSTNTRGVITGRTEDHKLITRTITMRKEKDGWKVQDVSGPRTENIGISNRGRYQSGR